MTTATIRRTGLDAVVVGAGPNGLAAAITLARAGRSVTLYEAAETVGGGCRSAELTEPGLIHDVCSAVHPLAAASPFFKTLPLSEHGLELVHPEAPLAHPLDGAPPAVLRRSVVETAAGLGPDQAAYRRLMDPLVEEESFFLDQLLGPLKIPSHAMKMAKFSLSAVRSATGLANSTFSGNQAKALLAGLAAHSLLSLDQLATAGFGLLLGMLGHSAGWPVVGGSQKMADALAGVFNSLGGEIVTGATIKSVGDLPLAKVYMFDVSPRQLVRIVGGSLPQSYVRRLNRFRYGPGVFKVDWALSGPIPWRDDECRGAGTLHLGGTIGEVEAGERHVTAGGHPERPFVLLSQPSLFDKTRAPEGRQTVWAYCHVPNGSTVDMTDRIESQVERFAPGFKDLIVAKVTMNTAQLESYDNNYIGGDINGGLQDIRQLFTRPVASFHPYATPNPAIYLCSASTPPGGGVHGMCGHHAAKSALRRAFR